MERGTLEPLGSLRDQGVLSKEWQRVASPTIGAKEVNTHALQGKGGSSLQALHVEKLRSNNDKGENGIDRRARREEGGAPCAFFAANHMAL